MASKSNTTQGNTPQAQPIVCNICGKPLKRQGSINVGHGKRCQFVAQLGNGVRNKLWVASVPNGYIKVAQLHKIIVQNKAKYPGISVSKMVKCMGTDKGCLPPHNPIAQPYYLITNSHRYVHPWLATPQGLQAIQTGNWQQAPKAPNIQTVKVNA